MFDVGMIESPFSIRSASFSEEEREDEGVADEDDSWYGGGGESHTVEGCSSLLYERTSQVPHTHPPSYAMGHHCTLSSYRSLY